MKQYVHTPFQSIFYKHFSRTYIVSQNYSNIKILLFRFTREIRNHSLHNPVYIVTRKKKEQASAFSFYFLPSFPFPSLDTCIKMLRR